MANVTLEVHALVTCSECQKSNTLDSQYCRSCGHALPVDLLGEARTANDQLATEGFKLMSEGRVDEAFLVAQTVLESDPGNIQGLSLKGDTLERNGDLAGALLCYEKVVELTPNSPLDRIKLDHVRRMLSQAAEPVAPNRRAAIGAAIAATALVACVGIALAITINNRNAVAASAKGNQTVAGNFPATDANTLPDAKQVSREEYERLKRESEAERAAAQANANRQTPAPPLQNPQPSGTRDTIESGGDVRPFNPGPITISPTNPNPAPNNSNPPAQGNSRPSVDPDPTPNGGGTTTPTRPNPGTVDIRPTPGGPENVGGSEVIADNTGTSWRDQLTKARQYFNTGDYAKAADAYERSLSAGANPASTNQRLGQCYQRLGRKDQAIKAYQNAVRYFTAELQSRPDDDSIKTALEACNQALANLK